MLKAYIELCMKTFFLIVWSVALYASDNKRFFSNEIVLEEVYIEGVLSSLATSLEKKENNIASSDVITAEEIGTFTDRNIAESLAHLPGISTQRTFGEGDRVTIRGLSSSLNVTQLNGQSFGTAEWYLLATPDRNFNYEMLSSEMISDIEVYKSSQADMDEGALGGTVVMNTYKPFDLKRNTFNINLNRHYDENSKEGDLSGSFLYSWKNEEDTLGFLISSSIQNRKVHREGTEVFGYIDSMEDNTLLPNAMGAALFQQDRERIGNNIDIQYAPTDDTVVNINYFKTQLNADNQNQNFINFVSRSLDDVDNELIKDGSIVTSMLVDPKHTRYSNIYRDGSKMSTESKTISVKHFLEDASWTTVLGQTKGKTVTNDNIYRFDTNQNLVANLNRYLYSPSGSRVDYGANPWIQNPSNEMVLSNAVEIRNRAEDQESYFQMDYEQEVDLGWIDGIKIGAKYRDRDFSQHRYNNHLRNAELGNESQSLGAANLFVDGRYTINHDTSQQAITLFDLHADSMNNAFSSLISCSEASNDELCVDKNVINTKQSYDISEKIFNLYAMVDFRKNHFFGNLGVRYTLTNSQSLAHDFSVDNANRYERFLPSLNLVYDGIEKTLVRFSASKAMARPATYQLSPAMTLIPSTGMGSAGNPDLNPMDANQLEFSTEWYFQEKSLLGATVFYKDIQNFIYEQSRPEVIDGTAYTSIRRPYNGDSALIKGIELNLQHYLTKGFGVQSNYTYLDTGNDDYATAKFIPFPLTSKDNFNLALYYEGNRWDGKVNYNYRSEFFKYVSGNGQIWGEKQGYLDAKVRYKVNPSFTLYLEGINLNDEILKEKYLSSHNNQSVQASQWDIGRRFYMGMNYQF
jgi:iron complex outermembrane receptor protein